MTFSIFTGKMTLQEGTFTVNNAELQSGGNKYLVAGTAASDGTLKVKLDQGGGKSYVISGTLDKPTVRSATTPESEAALR